MRLVREEDERVPFSREGERRVRLRPVVVAETVLTIEGTVLERPQFPTCIST